MPSPPPSPPRSTPALEPTASPAAAPSCASSGSPHKTTTFPPGCESSGGNAGANVRSPQARTKCPGLNGENKTGAGAEKGGWRLTNGEVAGKTEYCIQIAFVSSRMMRLQNNTEKRTPGTSRQHQTTHARRSSTAQPCRSPRNKHNAFGY